MTEYKYEVEIYDFQGDAVAWLDFDSEVDANEFLGKVAIGAGGEAQLLQYEYEDGKYIKTTVLASKA